jgi:hypothetical protein
LRPRPTLEKFLEVKIPEVLDLNITVENGRNFGLVIPKPNYFRFLVSLIYQIEYITTLV